MAGQVVYNCVAKAEADQIPLNTRGVYVVITENQSIKTIVE